MARKDRRISVLVPESRKTQYEQLAVQLGIPMATLAEILMSVGFDHVLRSKELRRALRDKKA